MSDLVNHLLDAQAVNAVQDRAIYDPTPETDSALEHALFLLKTANDSQRPHAVALVRALGEIRCLNTVEREHERQAAGVADGVNGQITSVHEFVRLARPVLGDLGNKLFSESRRAERRCELRDLFVRTHGRTLASISVRHLLGVAKYTTLVAELQAWQSWCERNPDHGLGLPLTFESLGVSA